MQKFDVIIVGSGLGGMICGYILSKEGYNVCILEKNHQLGGCLQTFVRNKCIFDTGMHYVGSLDEGQILNKFFKYFDLNGKLKLRKMDVDSFDIIQIAGKEYKYAQGYDNFIETLRHDFPNEKEALIKYVDKLKEVRGSLDSFMTNGILHDANNMKNFEYFNINTHQFLKSITNNYELQNVLAGLNALYAGHPDTNPFYLHAVINNSLIESSWRFVDGGSQLIDNLAASIIAHGGAILKKCEVKKFVSDSSGEIKYVELENKEQLEAKKFISNIHPVKTLDITDSKLIRPAYRNRIKSIENTTSIFSLYIVLKENSFKYFNYNYYYYKNPNVWSLQTYRQDTWPDGYMLYTPAHSKSEEYADCLTAITYLKYDELKQWENTTVENRGQDYIDFKQQKAERFIDEIENKFPDIRSHIKIYYTSTPLTYRDYTGSVNGSIYGILKDSNDPLKSFIIPRTRIPNLFFTGQNINLHGVLGVSIGSVQTCGEFLGLNYILDKIKKA